MIDPSCSDCAHWDSRDWVVGYCQEITDHLRHDPVLCVHGLASCRTAAKGRCSRFEPSSEARSEYMAEERHLADLRAGAGRDYPGSLHAAGRNISL